MTRITADKNPTITADKDQTIMTGKDPIGQAPAGTVWETEQDAFDMVVAGLSSQGWKRSEHAYRCLYFDPVTGRRCAVGWLLTGEEYARHKKEIEGQSAVQLKLDLNLPSLAKLDGAFLERLQEAHDRGVCPGDMYDMFLELAAERKLLMDRMGPRSGAENLP